MGEESATDTGTDVTVQTTRSRAVVPEKSGRRTGLLEKQKIGHDVPARTRRRQGSCRSRRNRDLRWTIPRRSRSSGSLAAFRFRGSGGRSGSTQRRHRPAAVRRCDHRRGTGCCREAAWHDPGRTDDEVPRSCEPGGPWRSRRRTAESFQGPWRKLRADSLPARTRKSLIRGLPVFPESTASTNCRRAGHPCLVSIAAPPNRHAAQKPTLPVVTIVRQALGREMEDFTNRSFHVR